MSATNEEMTSFHLSEMTFVCLFVIVCLSVQDLLRLPGGVLRLSQQTGGAVHEAPQRHDPLPDQVVSV